jgi:ELWxxDGT repeat protein
VRRPRDLTNIDGTLFFKASDRFHGVALWKSDGTRAGTKLVKDIVPGPEGRLAALHAFFGKLFFRANDGVHGAELWKSNGTSAGTRLLKDIEPGGTGAYPRALKRVGRRFIFSVPGESNSSTCQLWKSDGTRSGTRLVTGDAGCPTPAWIWGTTTVAGTVFFVGSNSGALWRTDGTRSGTRVVIENVEEEVEDPRSFTGAGGILFFAGGYSFPGDELWKVVP